MAGPKIKRVAHRNEVAVINYEKLNNWRFRVKHDLVGWVRRSRNPTNNVAAKFTFIEMPVSKQLKMQQSNDNVFLDLGFSADEAQNLLLRSEFMSKVRTTARGMPQQDAANLLGISQARLNFLLKGKIEKFSLDALVNMLAKAGMRVKRFNLLDTVK